MSELIDCCCCLCECFCGNQGKDGAMLCACCILYSKNVSGHKNRRHRFQQITLILVMSIIGIVLSSIALSNNRNFATPVSSIFDNWSSPSVIDIQLSNQCNENYEIIAQYEIPSTNNGCYCPETNTLVDKGVSTGACTDGENLGGCQTMQGKDPIKLHLWSQPTIDEEFITIQVCGRKSKQTFLDQLKKGIFDSKDCLANNLKVCDSNNPNNIVCVQQDEQCPITDLKISLYELSPFEQSKGTYSEIYNDKFYAYVSKTLDNTPLTQAIIVKGSGVCVFRNELSLNPKLTEDYKLNSITPSGCILDERYKSIASTYEDKLFISNDVLIELKNTRPLFEVRDDIQYQMMILNQITYKTSCRSSNFQMLQNLSEEFDTTETLIILLITFSSLLFVCIFLLFWNELGRCSYQDCKCIPNVVFFIWQWIFQYLFSITVLVTYAKTIILLEKIKTQVDQNCFDSITQSSLQQVLDSVQGTTLSLLWSLLIIVVVVALIDFLYTIIYAHNQYKKYKKKQLKQISKKQEQELQKQQPNEQQIYINQNEQLQTPNIGYSEQQQYQYQQQQQQQQQQQYQQQQFQNQGQLFYQPNQQFQNPNQQYYANNYNNNNQQIEGIEQQTNQNPFNHQQ